MVPVHWLTASQLIYVQTPTLSLAGWLQMACSCLADRQQHPATPRLSPAAVLPSRTTHLEVIPQRLQLSQPLLVGQGGEALQACKHRGAVTQVFRIFASVRSWPAR
jgi:hypothetical protein